jgi:uncharacterized protein Yka (UPF0111/DUF47 family)
VQGEISSVEPGYIALYDSGELKRRAERLEARLASCDICPRKCKVNRLENEADSIMRFALAELFDGMPPYDVIKWREIYDNLETALDRCEDVANQIESLVLEYS